MKTTTTLLFLSGMIALSACTRQQTVYETYLPAVENQLRAPAYPLVTIDPYTNAWSFGNQLNEDKTKHWTGTAFPLLGAIRVDGVSYRFLGREDMPVSPLVETAAAIPWEGVYTEKQPEGDWMAVNYNSNEWEKGVGAFGTDDTPHRKTPWNTLDIWVRRTFDLPEDISKEILFLEYSHDDNIEVYINGIEVATAGNGWEMNLLKEIPEKVKKALRPKGNVMAAHCRNNGGGAYVDLGIVKQLQRGDTFENKAVQTSANVTPTQTYYTFTCGPVALDVIFTAPLLMDDLRKMSAPYNYLTYQVRATDGKEHEVQVYIETTPQWAVNSMEQKVTFDQATRENYGYLKTGSLEQPILGKSGDGICIDWGYFYLAAPDVKNSSRKMGEYYEIKKEFIESGKLSGETDLASLSGDMRKEMTVLACSHDMGKVAAGVVNGYVMLAYDDIYSIQYFGENRKAYWTQDGTINIEQALDEGIRSYAETMRQCHAFDKSLFERAMAAGGRKYAELCALAYRQAISAHKLITNEEGELLFLSKENYSNGSIGTVDITYPSSPLFLIYNTELAKGLLNAIFYYSESGRWAKPFPSHDIGTYPLANGQTYGGDMPVEESGNMLIATTAISLREGNADYAARHWNVLTTWADYLVKEGLDPANQLCTDDFAGHFAHNTNLSIKAIMGIAGYAKMASMLGKQDIADKYTAEAQNMANQWIKMADDKDHYRLTFDKAGTWSQKYNLIWDRLLGFNLFPAAVAEKEMKYYLAHQNAYGLPLDNREDYTKSDWILWSACLTGNPEDFTALVEPVWKYANETTSRVPLSDWHFTSSGAQRGFQARSVVGGYYMKMLEHELSADARK